MRCAWQELLSVLPPWMRELTDKHGRSTLQELRMRTGLPPELIGANGNRTLERDVIQEDLAFVVNAASRYSPWAAPTVPQGYLTAPGGHRIGVAGEAVMEGRTMKGIRNIRSLCIRIARDFPGIAGKIPDGSVLVIGSPGAGKTTLLRDLIRQRSDHGPGSIAVIDERGELFPTGFPTGKRTDILLGCTKYDGIPLAIRTMGPAAVAVDEITEDRDADAICQACWCGVEVLATAHAKSASDLRGRASYRKLLEQGAFQHLVIMQEDKSWRTERISI